MIEKISQFIKLFYRPTSTYVYGEEIHGKNIYLWFFYFFVLGICLRYVILFFTKGRDHREMEVQHKNRVDSVFRTSLVVFLILTAFQLMSQIRYLTFMKETIFFSEVVDILDFSRFCQKQAPGKSQGVFFTDMDIYHNPEMYYHRLLAYNLYPLDIRDIREGEKEYCIFYLKNDAVQAVPEGYSILDSYGSLGLIARKQDGFAVMEAQ